MLRTHQQLAEAIADAIEPHAPTRGGAVEAVLDALAARPTLLREFADQQGPPAIQPRWDSRETDPARWLRGACSSGDNLRPAVVAVLDELALLRRQASPNDAEEELARVRVDLDQMGQAILGAEHQRVSVIAQAYEHETTPPDWSAYYLGDRIRDRETGEWVEPGWYLIAHEPGEAENCYATLQVHFAVDTDGREDLEGVARRLAAVLNGDTDDKPGQP